MTVAEAVADLLRFHSGRAVFVVGADGALAHRETVATVERRKGESEEAFIDRLLVACKPGDDLELLNNGGQATVARLTRRP